MAQETCKVAGYKRIILCADGTWLSSDQGNKSVPSNVAKITRAISKTGLDASGNLVKQVVFYQSGLGAGDLLIQKAIYGAIGAGLDIDILQLYDFISNNYETGDELFLFGFSRGAFTVRSVAGIVSDVGVLSPVNMSRFPEMWKAYRANTGGEPFRKSAWYLDNREKLGLADVTIKVVGVWDTVGALGIPNWPLVDFAKKIGIPINQQYAFHNTRVSKYVEYAFQALAIDEKRLPFSPTLWHKTNQAPAKDLQQCWFPGVHGNIGGQAEDPRSLGDHEEIGDNSFAWMVDNLSGMLTFDYAAIQILIEQHRRALNRIDAMQRITNGWGCGPIVDDFAGLQGAFFFLLGRADRKPGDYPRDPGDGTAGATNEYFHPIVRIRKLKLQGYNPVALQGYTLQEPHGGAGWKWAKAGVQAVPEYILRPRPMSVAALVSIFIMPSDANLKAAREVVQSRARYARGLHRSASIATTQPLSIRAAATRYPGSSSASIHRIVKILETGNTPRQVGRPRLLTDEEEEAIVAFVIWMERSGFPASKPEIEDAATTLLQRRNPDASPVSKMWCARFRDDHPEHEQALLKATEKSRESWEASGLHDLKQWFKQLTKAIRKYSINASKCWNTDQAGIRIGILKESIKVLRSIV
ncbi:hypothetical protein MRS44_017649 [Fusarium solani]|uniref:uncharacterized protein n=1 Tax=Fusarium solani TaxID=169388 RepID=UPI0032C4829D|nr:hypothetical protein MRS44_017649 [Fusarium solani]